MPIENRDRERLRSQLSRGELILFTGAGFSYSAVSKSGKPVPSANKLRQELWRLAFPSTPIDDVSQLGDVFEIASSRATKTVRDLLDDLLRVDAEKTPSRFSTWFSLPWYRHYTLNIDDLDEAIAGHYNLPRNVIPISAITDSLSTHQGLLSIHLNGRLDNYPNVTFSIQQYGQRATQPDVWYQTLIADLMNHPVLFIGTVLEEPGLWQYIELRRQRFAAEVEMRPTSYLVSPSLPAARVALLKKFNINWIQATEEEVFSEILAGATAQAEMGHEELRRRYQPVSRYPVIRPLSELRSSPPPDDLSIFLIGRTPAWADILNGFAIERWFESSLLESARTGANDIVLLTGTAASGKSTTAMRLALALEAEGYRTYVVDTVEGPWSVGATLDAVKRIDLDVLLIDDIDVFGSATSRLLRELSNLEKPPLVIAAIRSSRLQGLDLVEDIADLKVFEQTIPYLHDQDVDALLSTLSKANRLGRLAGMATKQRRQVFKKQAGRQLLVAMYYATSGDKLQDRVYSECEDLSGTSRLAYGMTALATIERQWTTRDELLLGIGAIGPSQPGNQELNEIRQLIERNLILAKGQELRLRHRWIAETTLDFYIDNGLIGSVLKAFSFMLAVKVDPQMDWRSRPRKMLRRMMNHDYLIRTAGDAAVIREIYSFLEEVLAWDYHYWLQRGSFEVEAGDLALAENFLNSARSLSPTRDYIVETEYAYMKLKSAAKRPKAPGSVERAEEALRNLEDVMLQRGREDSYPFHVYGSQGLSWARRAPISPDERRNLLRGLLDAVERGLEYHPRRRDLQQLRDDLKRECMMTTVNPS